MTAQSLAKYQADDATKVYQIKISATKLAVAGDPPNVSVTEKQRAYASRPKRRYGVQARYVTAETDNGATIGTTKAFERFPVLTQTAFNSAAFANGATISYGGKTWTIVGRTPESIR